MDEFTLVEGEGGPTTTCGIGGRVGVGVRMVGASGGLRTESVLKDVLRLTPGAISTRPVRRLTSRRAASALELSSPRLGNLATETPGAGGSASAITRHSPREWLSYAPPCRALSGLAPTGDSPRGVTCSTAAASFPSATESGRKAGGCAGRRIVSSAISRGGARGGGVMIG